jgi:hypothetical protein
MTQQTMKKSQGMSLEDLDNKFNPNVIIPKRINEALIKLGDNAMTVEDFRKFSNVSTTQLALFSSQFEDFQVTVRDSGRPKALWCGTKAFAKKARERIGS